MGYVFVKIISITFITISCVITASIAEEKALTLVSFKGISSEIQSKYMIDPYIEQTKHPILSEHYSGDIAEIKAQVASNNIRWDIVEIAAMDLERACNEGILEPLPKTILSKGNNGIAATQDFLLEALFSECGIGTMIPAYIFAFNEQTIGKIYPKNLNDIFDIKKIPGKRAFRQSPQINLEWALLADGVPKEVLYQTLATEQGQQRAFVKLDSIKEHIIWFNHWSQAPELLDVGGAVIVQSANGDIYHAITQKKKPFRIVWDDNIYDLNMWGIVKGTKHKQTALDFIAFATGSKALASMSNIAYAPTRKSSMTFVSPNVIPFLPTTHMKQGLKADSHFWSDYGETLTLKFNQWLLKQ
ncbi:extracellular solute-binding protein [uncultured Shewanella sp.]|uniref:extracellular solute-binding protein n=1 Tax=uncultured Shewanella sp. TaxID=173975 RepID=UPI00263706EF|nr:extracellular solute-binding protein [uncultured Shewanella sp.]